MSDKTVNACQRDPLHGLPVLAPFNRPSRWARSFCSCLLIGLLLSVWGCGRKIKFSETSSSGPVVVLGDSLAAGYQLSEGQGFIEVLEGRLGVEMENLSEKGITTEDALPWVKEQVLPLKPALVIIELGGNDALQKVDPSETQANLQSMIDQIHAEKIPILVLGVRGGLMSDKFEGMFEELVAKNELAYVPNIIDGMLTNPGLRLDNVHPNAKGHQIIADRVEPVLTDLLSKIGIKN